jgi:hypothetical protein
VPKGKTPSLIGSSLGRPKAATAGRLCKCSRCKVAILRDDKCFDVPQPQKSFSATRRFCSACFGLVLEQSKKDLAELDGLWLSERQADATVRP